MAVSRRPTSLGDLRNTSLRRGGRSGAPPLRMPPMTIATLGNWYHKGASIDLDFVNNRIFGGSSFASALAITRASVGYAEDASGNWTSFAANVLRRTNKGLLIEEARTNAIRNNSMQGAVAGTPGTLPNLWAGTFASSGLSQAVVGTGTINGIDYIDIRVTGTTTVTVGNFLAFDASSGQVAAATGALVTASVFAHLLAAPAVSNVSIELSLREDASGAFVRQTLTDLKTATTMKRISNTVTTGATTTHASAGIRVGAGTGVTVDFTLRIGWPQLELGAFVTSPIRTTNAAATRAADAVTLNNPTDFLSLAQGTVLCGWTEGPASAAVESEYLAQVFVDANNRVALLANAIGASKKSFMQVINASVTQASFASVNPVVAGAAYKFAGAWQTDRFAMRVSPSLGSPANDNSGTLPSGTPAFRVGMYSSGLGFLNGYLRRMTLFPTALSDARLEALVA